VLIRKHDSQATFYYNTGVRSTKQKVEPLTRGDRRRRLEATNLTLTKPSPTPGLVPAAFSVECPDASRHHIVSHASRLGSSGCHIVSHASRHHHDVSNSSRHQLVSDPSRHHLVSDSSRHHVSDSSRHHDDLIYIVSDSSRHHAYHAKPEEDDVVAQDHECI
jgi:hypothetical protein